MSIHNRLRGFTAGKSAAVRAFICCGYESALELSDEQPCIDFTFYFSYNISDFDIAEYLSIRLENQRRMEDVQVFTTLFHGEAALAIALL